MSEIIELIDNAVSHLGFKRTFRNRDQILTVVCLVRKADWRPLDAPWWKGKYASIIGTDINGNFFLCHCDGTVRYWDHQLQADSIISPSVRDFIARIE